MTPGKSFKNTAYWLCEGETMIAAVVSQFRLRKHLAATLAGALFSALVAGPALAQSGSWNVDADGLWSGTSNWLNGTIGQGIGGTATFANNITAPRTVTLDTSKSLGRFVFGDADTSSAASWIVSGTNSMTMNNGTNSATITVNALGTGATATISAVLAASGTTPSIIKDGVGTLVLAGTNSFTTKLAITSGTLQASVDRNLGAVGTFATDRISISNGAALRTTAAFTLNAARGITIGSGGGTISVNGGNLTIAAPLAGSGNTATVTGANAVVLQNTSGTATNVNWDFASNSGTRDFFEGTNALGTGSVRVRSGVRLTSQSMTTGTVTNAVTLDSGAGLTARSTGGAQTYTNVIFPSTGTLVFNKDDQTTSNLTITSGGTLAGSLTIDTSPGGSNPVNSVFFDGVFSGAGGLVKGGTGATGSLVLRGANTYTGNTTINTGTLRLGTGGSMASTGTISVASGAVFDTTGVGGGFSVAAAQWLMGSGSVLGDVSSLGTIAPGLSGSAGTLSFANDLSLDSGSFLSYGLSGTNTTAGGGINDLSAVTGNLSLDGTLNVSEIGVGSFLSATVGNIWRLITYSGTLTNNGLVLGSTPTLSSGLTFAVDTSTPNEVNLIVVPEPAMAVSAMVGIGALAMLRARLTRKKNRAIVDGCRLNEQR
jgi:fibronectin-binding autotransporter adhesin